MMNENGSPPTKKIRTLDDFSLLSEEALVKKCQKQQEHIELLQAKSNTDDANQEKEKSLEPSRRENVLVMRLANKEQEVQDYVAQINHDKKVQDDAAILSLRQTNLDPGINLLFGKMREELQQTKSKLEQAQSELSAWKFTPDSQNGKKLISRCRTLIAENQELGRQLSHGKAAQLEAELALQKKYSEELKASQDELNEFVIQLDEEVEGMQSTIQLLQRELASAKQENEEYKRVIEDYEKTMNFKGENDSVEFADRSPVVSDVNESDNEADYEMADIEQQSGTFSFGSRRTSSRRSSGNPDSDRESDSENKIYIMTEEANSPGTPSSERARSRTHASFSRSPSLEQMDDVNACFGDSRDDRTSSVGDESLDYDQVEVEVENEEVASSSDVSDDDIINTHNRNAALRTSPRSDSNDQCSPVVYDKPVKDDDAVSTNEFAYDKSNMPNNSWSTSESLLEPKYDPASHQSTQNATAQSTVMPDKSTLVALIAKDPDLGPTMDVHTLLATLQNPAAFKSDGEYDVKVIQRLAHQILIQKEHENRTTKEEPQTKPCGTSSVSNNHAHDALNGIDENASDLH